MTFVRCGRVHCKKMRRTQNVFPLLLATYIYKRFHSGDDVASQTNSTVGRRAEGVNEPVVLQTLASSTKLIVIDCNINLFNSLGPAPYCGNRL